MADKTTPRPWRLTESEIVSDAAWLIEPSEVDGEPGVPITVINLTGACSGELGDLPFIVTAVNSHDALVAALRELTEQAHSVLDGIEDGKDDDLESAYQRAFALLEEEDRRANGQA